MKSRFIYKRKYKNLKFLLLVSVIVLLSVIIKLEDYIYIVYSALLLLIIVIKNEQVESLLENELESSLHKQRYKLAVEILDAAIWEWYEDEGLLYLSSRMRGILETDEVIDNFKKLEKYIFSKDLEKAKKIYCEFIKSNKIGDIEFELRLQSLSGRIIPYKITGNSKIDVKGSYFINGVAIDQSYRKEQEKKLEESEKNYRRALLGTKDIMFCLDIKTENMILNGNVFSLFNKGEKALSKKELLKYILEGDRIKIKKLYNSFDEKEGAYYETEFRIRVEDKIKWVSLRGKTFIEDNKFLIFGSLSDISDRKEKEDKINFMSYYDEVTGIPNRRYFNEKVKRRISICLEKKRNLAIVFIDLDNFKYINDTYGHDIGDELLKNICNSIYKIIGIDSVIARFGGDEFVLSIENFKTKDELEGILDNIIKVSNIKVSIDNRNIYCTLSMGVTVLRVDGYELKTLLKKADVAMYNAKSLGKNQYNFFDRDVSEKIDREFKIKEGLIHAIEEKELYGMLQPKYYSKDQTIEGYEYLVRWESSELGIVPPFEFIPIAESFGLINEIGEYVIEDAFSMIKELGRLSNKDFKIAINISEVQIRDDAIVNFIRKKIEEYNIDTRYIEIEITESVIMKCAEKNIDTLRKLKSLGITIALDDFGTGYSSLSYLRVLPIDVLKIDKSFVDYINKEKKSEYIIEKIIELSHSLNLKVVAEGVETKEQFKYLKNVGCDLIQGYYFSKPKSYGEILQNEKDIIKKVNV
ncbi:EAL domain-containing protein [Clostridium sp. LY3-2]|uniref:sensor domain-containing protein n=1 Tax=Clostridium sp. LY3-2 TaxID=2942482 RepID=UPI0021535518|nr:GGDEF domain-containing phosphodiesterase [Clostridium sp. LY3-2]MCR6513638.1 EAL domain-containing protein [Clostridium sp. LY3-2]